MIETDKFLNKLYQLADALDGLSREFENLPQLYDGSDFEGQQELAADKLENLLISATHEVAEVIRFIGNDIQLLTRYIEFRKKFPHFTEEELELIIDNLSIPMKFKLDLKVRLYNNDVALMLKSLQNIRKYWSDYFGDLSYQEIKSSFPIVNE